jgi:hypothetical protein
MPPVNNPVNSLFQSAQVAQGQIPLVNKGSVIAFHYAGQTDHLVNDPYPLVIVSDVYSDSVRGVNLHYLTMPTVRDVLIAHGNNKRFSYAFVKGQEYIVRAFRSYKRLGITNLKMLDVTFLQQVLSVVRALNPGEIDAMRAQIRLMMQRYPIRQAQAVPTPPVPVEAPAVPSEGV